MSNLQGLQLGSEFLTRRGRDRVRLRFLLRQRVINPFKHALHTASRMERELCVCVFSRASHWPIIAANRAPREPSLLGVILRRGRQTRERPLECANADAWPGFRTCGSDCRVSAYLTFCSRMLYVAPDRGAAMRDDSTLLEPVEGCQ
jgi:hypothetical protein